MKKIKISFIGVGFFSQISHVINYYKNPKVELFEICDLDKKMAEGVKKKFGFTGRVFSDYKKMTLNKTDGFVIIVQRRLINEIAKYFLKRGCNIFTEKPHAYSVNDFIINKNYQRGVWLKGYTRRSDLSVRNLKKNFKKLSKNLGQLISVNFEAKNGNSYLGSKHYVKPEIKKTIKSKESKYPFFLNKKNQMLYDSNLNSACHSIDLFDYFNFKNFKNINPRISQKEFLVNFNCVFNNNLISSRIHLSGSRVYAWYEKMEFLFDFGQIQINFNAPLFKLRSHEITIKNYKLKKEKVILYKRKWSFNEQSKRFIDLIVRNKKGFRQDQDSLDGIKSIFFYENIWKKQINLEKNKHFKT